MSAGIDNIIGTMSYNIVNIYGTAKTTAGNTFPITCVNTVGNDLTYCMGVLILDGNIILRTGLNVNLQNGILILEYTK